MWAIDCMELFKGGGNSVKNDDRRGRGPLGVWRLLKNKSIKPTGFDNPAENGDSADAFAFFFARDVTEWSDGRMGDGFDSSRIRK
jgi:hypothetical protein